MSENKVGRRGFFHRIAGGLAALMIVPFKSTVNTGWYGYQTVGQIPPIQYLAKVSSPLKSIDFSGMTGCGSTLAEGNSVCDSSGYWDEDDEDMGEESLGRECSEEKFLSFSYSTEEYIVGTKCDLNVSVFEGAAHA